MSERSGAAIVCPVFVISTVNGAFGHCDVGEGLV